VLDISENMLCSEYEMKNIHKLEELYEINYMKNPFCNEEFDEIFLENNRNLELVNNIVIFFTKGIIQAR
jgi:hypothetical protein